MKLISLRAEEGKYDIDPLMIRELMDALSRGKLVVYPTDTLYALGADAYDRTAVKKLFKAKKRPKDQPISVAVANLEQIEEIAILDERVSSFCEKCFPGPFTLILKRRKTSPGPPVSTATGIGVRIPDHPLALSLVDKYGPVTSTSANIHEGPLPREVKTAMDQLGESVDYYVDCGPCKHGGESTVIDLTGESPRIIRKGIVSLERLGLDEL